MIKKMTVYFLNVIIIFIVTVICPSESLFCGYGERFSLCGNHKCQATCKYPQGPRFCEPKCWPGCICNSGLIRRESDHKCVPIEDCSYKPPQEGPQKPGIPDKEPPPHEGPQKPGTPDKTPPPPGFPDKEPRPPLPPSIPDKEQPPPGFPDKEPRPPPLPSIPDNEPSSPGFPDKEPPPPGFPDKEPSFPWLASEKKGVGWYPQKSYRKKPDNHEASPIECARKGEVYKTCGTDPNCLPTCKDRAKKRCDRMCHVGCYCPKGFLRINPPSNKQCVPEDQCPAIHKQHSVYLGLCPEGQTFSLCGNHQCQPTCKYPAGPLGCEPTCRPGCVCKYGLVRRESDHECVPLEKCPQKGFLWLESEKKGVGWYPQKPFRKIPGYRGPSPCRKRRIHEYLDEGPCVPKVVQVPWGK